MCFLLYNDVIERLIPTVFLDSDKEVEFQVDLLNKHFEEINTQLGRNSTRIWETLVVGKKRLYFELLPDGVHSSHLLAKKWLRRLELDIVRECYLPTDTLELDKQVFLAFS